MKANEMPEKVYLFDYNDAMVTPMEGDTVYVREDAFIERAEEWLRKNQKGFILTDKDITDFVNYMKGE